jgi:hypothetical protein
MLTRDALIPTFCGAGKSILDLGGCLRWARASPVSREKLVVSDN